MKKLISLLLAVIMVCSTGISAFAINATPTVTPATVKAGEDVTVNVTVDEAYSELIALETRLYFNAELFTVKSVASNNSDITVRKDTMTDENGSYLQIGLTSMQMKGAVAAGEVIATVVFTAKANVTEKIEAKFATKIFGGATASGDDIPEGTPKEIVIAVLPKPCDNHDLVHHDAVAATCVAEGNIEYWECSVCHYLFSDSEGKNEISSTATPKDPQNHVGETEIKNDRPATCDENGYTGDTYCKSCGALLESGSEIPATGHKWGEATYQWSSDYKTVTAKAVCENDSTHVRTEKVNTTAKTEDATCTTPGKVTYTAEFAENEYGFETQTQVVNGEALGHDWGETTYTWSSDYKSCTATHTCNRDASHTETETAKQITYLETVKPTCETAGEGRYTATFEKFDSAYGYVELSATGHKWGEATYEWSADNSSVTAKVVCENDSNHVHTEKVNTTAKTEDATCTVPGKVVYIAEFAENEYGFTTQTKDVEGEALGHLWGETVYTWSNDNKTATADHTCKRDSSHTESENVDAVYSVVKDATCEAAGEGKWTATFTKFAAAEKTVEISALGHKLVHHDAVEATCAAEGNIEYWECSVCHKQFADENGTTLVNTVVIKKDMTKHVGGTELKNVKAATCGEEGYTGDAVCKSCGTVLEAGHAIPKTAHKWGTPSYEWSSDNKTVTAKVVCANDSTHVHTETVNTTAKNEGASCTVKGKVTYTAEFAANNEYKFTTQTKVVENAALGHDWGETVYTWSADNKTVTATHTCKRDQSHTETETASSVYSVVKAATCTETGEGKFVATFKNASFANAEKTQVINKLGHNYGEPVYNWSEDGKSCVGERVCKNDSTHKQTQQATITSKVLKAATCTEKGSVEYTADFGVSNYGFTTQTKVVETAALGHKLTHHDAVAATCVAEGSIEYWSCSVCGKLYSDKDAKNEVKTTVTAKDPKNHVGETEVKGYVEATCTKSGYTGDTYCKSCGELISEGKVSPVVPHKFGAWTVTKQPTKSSAGEKVRYCEVCQYEQKMEIPRLSDGDVIHIGIGDNKGESNPETGAPAPSGLAAIAVIAAAAVALGKKRK